MKNARSNADVVKHYIRSIWNARQLDRVDEFVADEYCDFSFLPAIPPTREGLKIWIENTSLAFDHETVIEAIVEEADHVAVRLTFTVKHIGKWRGIAPTYKTVSVKGFRFFRLRDQKIVQHWALIDGEALQTALTEQHHGCEIPIDFPQISNA